MPETILLRCKADESFIAHIITQKFIDHLPLYRISEILQRGDIHISRKVLSRWVCQVAENLRPLHEALNKKELAAQNIFADETPLAMLKPGNQKVHQGYMWTIAGGINGNPEDRVYHFRTSREHKHIQGLLKGYRGNLHSDKYGSYEKLAKGSGITWIPCYSHIRRKFFEARPSIMDPKN
ncbi:MAG: IS66 family transposase [Chlamydiia bacterium]|nr:IS66 family transposase [Chlamydiia bacterium]